MGIESICLRDREDSRDTRAQVVSMPSNSDASAAPDLGLSTREASSRTPSMIVPLRRNDPCAWDLCCDRLIAAISAYDSARSGEYSPTSKRYVDSPPKRDDR